MGLLDSIRGAVTSAKSAVSEAATEVKAKVTEKAAEVGHAVESRFDSKPASPSAPAGAAAPSSHPTVSARSLGGGAGVLNNSLTSLFKSKAPEAPKSPAEAAAQEMIKRHTSSWTGLDSKGLAAEMRDLTAKDPAAAAATVNAVINAVPSNKRDNVGQEFATLQDGKLRELAMTPDGKAALELMSKELHSGWDTADERSKANRLDKAVREAIDPDNHDAQVKTAAAATYNVNGNTSYDLNDSAKVKELIVNSPQLDNLSGTTRDETRCAGASMLNAMLLDGNPAANAAAIQKIVNDKEVKANMSPPISGDEQAGLDAMKSGKMTPTNAANVQELVLRLANTRRATDEGREAFSRGNSGGTTPSGLAELSQELRQNGAFASSKDVTFHANMDGKIRHWTVDVTDKNGVTQNADSFPKADGKGAVKPGATTMPGNSVDFKISNRPDGKVVYTASGSAGGHRPPPRSTDPQDASKYVDVSELLLQFAKHPAG